MKDMIEALREKAEAATPGPWTTKSILSRTDRPDIEILGVFGPSHVVDEMDGIAIPDRMSDRLFTEDAANMEYIAAASPDVILSLLSERDRLRAALGTIANETARCVHDGGFDREIGPIGCLLGEKCVCIGVHPVARAALTPMDVKEERG